MLEEEKKVSNQITDNKGRQIKLKEINGKTRISFFRALGPRDSANHAILAEYWNVMAVDSIDGDVVGSIKSLIDIEATYSKLEDSNANELINEWLEKKARESVLNEKEAKDGIKK